MVCALSSSDEGVLEGILGCDALRGVESECFENEVLEVRNHLRLARGRATACVHREQVTRRVEGHLTTNFLIY